MQEYDWPYESWWFRTYHRVGRMLREQYPNTAVQFEQEIDRLRAPASFRETTLSNILSSPDRQRVIEMIDALADTERERHEFMYFGRDVVHNHPLLNELHETFRSLASECAGEPLVASYNFLSLYNNLGVCELHMDAPLSQWTLDVCVRQTHPWAIHMSDSAPWPSVPEGYRKGWREELKASQQFRSHAMNECDALFFAGSSQWHYRERIPRVSTHNTCQLMFFHFISESCLGIADPRNWAEHFDCAAIAGMTNNLAEFEGTQMLYKSQESATES